MSGPAAATLVVAQYVVSSSRLATPSFEYTARSWFATVFGDVRRDFAISAFDWPSSTPRTTACSLRVSPAGIEISGNAKAKSTYSSCASVKVDASSPNGAATGCASIGWVVGRLLCAGWSNGLTRMVHGTAFRWRYDDTSGQ